MSTACRHCYPEAESLESRSKDFGPITYRSVLAFGHESTLESRMGKIESELGVLHGVTTWCEKCRRCSILSYTLYVQLSMQTRVATPVEHPLDYYSRMCDLAERMTGMPLGFCVNPTICDNSMVAVMGFTSV